MIRRVCHQAACLLLSPLSLGVRVCNRPPNPGLILDQKLSLSAFPFCSRISIAIAIASRRLTLIYSRKLDFEDAGARQGIILVWKSGLPIMNFLSGDGESMRLGP
jgi:hypothetical protein